VTELEARRVEWLAADDAANLAWEAVSRLTEGKEYIRLRKAAWEAKKLYHAAWIAELRLTYESAQDD
jgi:hypothetical protein